MASSAELEALRAQLRADRFRAHEVLFAHRHEHPFAPFHRDFVADFWTDDAFRVLLGFRECGKTTLCEEDIVIAAADGEHVPIGQALFRNCLIVGANEALATELLQNIKAELEHNEAVLAVYGDVRGDTWQQTRITFSSGRCIKAIGRGQSLRGTKHRDWRPDLVIVNDFEDEEEALSPEGRKQTVRWVLRVLLRACDAQRRKIRVYDSLRDPDSVPMQLIRRSNWSHRLIPIAYLDEDGVERTSWPGHPAFTDEWIANEKRLYAEHGELNIWNLEMMCDATAETSRVFQAEHFRVEEIPRTWQAVYGMYDPARTVGRRSAMTGWAFWSWVRNRLIVWECGAKHLLPDEIIEHIFQMNRRFGPVEIGVEEDGLNEWLLQPIRARMLGSGIIPYRAVKAPRGKIDFIRGLQPFFAANEVVLANDVPELREQLLGFPTGRIDAPNALAYALLLKPGRLIYQNWNPNAHIESIEPAWSKPFYLAANATRSLVGAALVQLADGRALVLGDWLSEGDPGAVLERVVREASLASGGARLTLIAGRKHWEQYGNVGLVQAARSLGVDCRPAGDPARGREWIRRELGRVHAEGPAFSVAPAARWILNGFAGGYSVPLKDGALVQEPADNNYKLLFEGLETFAGLLAFGLEGDDEQPGNWAYDAQGRRYRSAMPDRMMRH